MAAPFWIKLAASELVRYKLVSSVRIHSHYLTVCYKSGVVDRYYFSGKLPYRLFEHKGLCFRVVESDFKIGPAIPLERTYEINPLDPAEQAGCAHHFYLDRKHLRAGSFIDSRFAIHRFVAQLTRSQLTLDRYPDRTVGKWIENLRGFKYGRMIRSDAFNFYEQLSVRVPWRQVLWQFFPPTLKYQPYQIATILTKGLRSSSDLDTATVIRVLRRRISGHTLNPLAYCAILEGLRSCEAVIDLHPERGYKAIACGLLGIPYFYRACDEMEFALDRRIIELLGLTCEPVADQRADVLLSDGNFERFDMEGTTPYLGRVNTMVAYAPRAERLRLMAEYKPTRVVKVLCRYTQGRRFKRTAEDPDFLLIW